ncbi:Hypothetical protein I5071_81970 [Sandaracinus amylolyticus]|nr:Hypothetical protein I5071_81970 [Sandaracinus amylolyticus]
MIAADRITCIFRPVTAFLRDLPGQPPHDAPHVRGHGICGKVSRLSS